MVVRSAENARAEAAENARTSRRDVFTGATVEWPRVQVQRRDRLRRILAAAAFLLGGCATLAPAPRHEIVAYYPAWKGAITFDASLVTVVNYAFLEVAPDGALALSQPAIDRAHFETLRALRAKYPHLRLLASVGGWTRSDRFSDMANDAAARARFTQTTLDFPVSYTHLTLPTILRV